MLKTLYAFLIALLLVLPANAQGVSSSMGWNTGNNSNIGIDEQVLTPVARPNLPQSRYLDVDSGLTKTDNGSGSSFVIGLGPVLTYFLNTGATTQQSAVNAILQFSGVTAGDIVYYNGTNWVRLPKGANGTFLGIDGSGNLNYGSPSGSGTVTSVGQTVPSWLSVSGSPVTGSGTLAIANGTGLSNWYVVGTNGSGALDLRALDPSHIPNLDVAKITSGAFAKVRQHANTVYNDASNTYSTGAQDLSAAGVSFKLPTDAPTTGGQLSYRSNKVQWHNGTTTINAANEARAINTTSPLDGGGDLSADRTLSLTTVPPTLGGTGQNTCVKGDLFIGDTSANTVTKLAIGSTGQVPTVSGGTLVYATPASGGLFRASSITATARTLPTSGALSGTYIHDGSVTSAGTYTFTHDTRIYLKGDLTIGHTMTGTAQSNGGSHSTALNGGSLGGGLGPGTGGCYQYGGGGGGASAGAGGRGGYTSNNATFAGGFGGKPYTTWGAGGSGGGAGAGDGSSGVGKDGGGGGPFLLIEVDGNVTINETISANGAAGTNATSTAGGGGGSGGGQICIRCTGTLTLASGKKIQANGGGGGNHTGSGLKAGGGGGGKVQTWSGGSTTLTGSLESLGGSKGTGTAATLDAVDGSAGTTETIQNTAPISLFILQSMPLRPVDNVIEFRVKKDLKKCG